MRRAAVGVVLAALVSAVPAAAAPTAFPARNGEITFASNTGDTVVQELFTVSVDGSGRRAVTHLNGSHYLPSWSPDGKRVAFVFQGPHENSIAVANADGTNEGVIAPNAAGPPTWSPDGRELAYSRIDPASPPAPEIWIVSPNRSSATRLGPGVDPSWSPDGTQLVASSADLRHIVVYDRATGTSRQIADAGPSHDVVWARWSPRGTEIAYQETDDGGAVNENATVHLVEPSGAGQHVLIKGTFPMWAPGGDALAVQAGKLLVVGLDGGVEAEAPDGGFLWPSWSPDGRFLAYASGSAPSAIFVVRRDGSDRRQLTHEVARSSTFYPAWSPDGTRILFSSIRSQPDADLYSVRGVEAPLEAITADDDVDQAEPAWSPDGTRLAYVEQFPTVAPRSQRTTRLLIDGRRIGRDGDHSPAWSPDGSRLAFVRGDAIWIERDDGTRARRVVRGVEPAWSPDGLLIAYVTSQGALNVVTPDGRRSRVLAGSSRLKAFLGAAQAGTAWSPTWSPDGRTVAFVGTASNFHAAAVVSAVVASRDGRRLSVIASGIGGNLAWAPDGSILAATAADHVVLVDPATGAKTDVMPELLGWAADPAWRPRCGLSGTARGDVLRGSAGRDLVCGLGGADRITGGPGADRLFGGAGDDVILAHDGTADVVGCGPGRDTVVADRQDLVGADCERIRRLP